LAPWCKSPGRTGGEGNGTPAHAILHGRRFALVDEQSRARGYYDVSEQQGFEALIMDMEFLMASANETQRQRRTE